MSGAGRPGPERAGTQSRHEVRAATEPRADGQHYNLTDGEVFEWHDLWPALAEELGVEAGADEPLSMAEFLPFKAAVWDRIVDKHGLRRIGMQELLGESHHHADFCSLFGATEDPLLAFVSTVEIKQHGFGEVMDTEESFRHWIRVLQERRVLPPRDR